VENESMRPRIWTDCVYPSAGMPRGDGMHIRPADQFFLFDRRVLPTKVAEKQQKSIAPDCFPDIARSF
jgi:hypothetical protein